jgi:hypothetical protein
MRGPARDATNSATNWASEAIVMSEVGGLLEFR